MANGEKFSQSDFGAEAGRVTPTVLTLATGFNASDANTYYWQLFDASALPTDGAVPVRSIVVGPLSNFSHAPSQTGLRFDTGMWWALSSTPDTLTHANADSFWVSLEGREVA